MDETLEIDTGVRRPKKNKKKKQPITWRVIKNQNQLIWMSVPLMLYIILLPTFPYGAGQWRSRTTDRPSPLASRNGWD